MIRRTPGLVSVAGLVAVLALTGCSEKDAQRAADRARDEVDSALRSVDVPKVKWDRYGTKLRNRLDRLADSADCKQLKRELTSAEKNDEQLTRYIKVKLRQANC